MDGGIKTAVTVVIPGPDLVTRVEPDTEVSLTVRNKSGHISTSWLNLYEMARRFESATNRNRGYRVVGKRFWEVVLGNVREANVLTARAILATSKHEA